ncbi:MAG TPA: type II toxin-antitoxin system HipA family toxin [Kofleriaceae bacterium]|nr:type II toxin-antitoxin system HipA family toxin [Kofleriaceae bacterium]
MIPVTRLTVSYEPEEGRRITVGRLGRREHELLFEYDPAFLARGLELSPFKLPLRPGVVTGDPGIFQGLPGLFEDSLPDGWGRLLIDRRAAKMGVPTRAMGPLDRLALIGARAMGALVYEPEVELEPPTVVSLPDLAADVAAVLDDAWVADLDRLIALGGSPQGARPKALVQVSAAGSVIFGERLHHPGCTPYVVKFLARGDDRHAGTLEHVYALMAAAAGIDVPATTMLGRTRRHPGYFATRRFDRDGTRKIHAHTIAGLLHAPHDYPSMTYRDLLIATRQLTRDERAVAALFRRACFNVFAHNRDDHTRNFAFLMDERGGWRPSPAYDLTCSDGPGGEHAMLVGGTARDPGEVELRDLARNTGVRGAAEIIDAVRAAVGEFARHAEAGGLPRTVTSRVARLLGLAPRPRASARRRAPGGEPARRTRRKAG